MLLYFSDIGQYVSYICFVVVMYLLFSFLQKLFEKISLFLNSFPNYSYSLWDMWLNKVSLLTWFLNRAHVFISIDSRIKYFAFFPPRLLRQTLHDITIVLSLCLKLSSLFDTRWLSFQQIMFLFRCALYQSTWTMMHLSPLISLMPSVNVTKSNLPSTPRWDNRSNL